MSAFAMGVSPPDTTSLSALTPRQREVIHWVRDGKSNWETAQILGCSEGTVKKHLQRIFDKYGVSDRRNLMRLAMRPSY